MGNEIVERTPETMKFLNECLDAKDKANVSNFLDIFKQDRTLGEIGSTLKKFLKKYGVELPKKDSDLLAALPFIVPKFKEQSSYDVVLQVLRKDKKKK